MAGIVRAIRQRDLADHRAKRRARDREAVGHRQAGRDQPRERGRLAAAAGVGVGERADPHAHNLRYDQPIVRGVILTTLLLAGTSATARADDSKLAKEDVPLQAKTTLRAKDKLCCGYPLVADQGNAQRFYWLTRETTTTIAIDRHAAHGGRRQVPTATSVELYTPDGFFLARVPERFAWSLRLEGSGLMRDDRVVNYTGTCKFGYGTCFEQLDTSEFPFGRGAGLRPLIPFKSVAVDPRVIPIGEPIYVPIRRPALARRLDPRRLRARGRHRRRHQGPQDGFLRRDLRQLPLPARGAARTSRGRRRTSRIRAARTCAICRPRSVQPLVCSAKRTRVAPGFAARSSCAAVPIGSRRAAA